MKSNAPMGNGSSEESPVSQSVEEKHRCEGCGTVYAEYVNGCPRCWDDTLSREENLRKYPNRKVVPFANKSNESVSQSVEGWKPTLEWWRNHGLNQCNYDECYCQSAYELVLLGDTLSTLVEKMEKEMKSTENCACEGVDSGSCIGECDVSFNAGISAAVEVVKKMGV